MHLVLGLRVRTGLIWFRVGFRGNCVKIMMILWDRLKGRNLIIGNWATVSFPGTQPRRVRHLVISVFNKLRHCSLYDGMSTLGCEVHVTTVCLP